MTTPAPPCRLSVLLARAAPVGVLFRRGPKSWVQVIHWDTDGDIFTPGQWFHGRLFGERGDLSPNGRLLIYFAEDQRRRARESDYTTHWTAISRPPYLTALALWPNGYQWAGGGLFLSNTEVWLDQPPDRAEAHPHHPPQGLTVSANRDGGGWVSSEARRLARDGWETVQEWQFEDVPGRGPVARLPRVQRKPGPRGSGALTLTTRRADWAMRQVYTDADQTPLAGAEWADWDQHGRMVFARGGKIFALAPGSSGQARELADLNANTFESVEAPDWAKTW